MRPKFGFGIEVSSTCLRIAHIAQTGDKIEIVESGSLPLPAQRDAIFTPQTAREFQTFLNDKKWKIPRAVIAIAGEHVSMRYLRSPSSSPTRIHELTTMEVAQILEKSPSDLVYNYLPLVLPDHQTSPERLVILALARDSFLEEIRCFLAQAGIKSCGFVPSSMALFQAYSRFTRNQPQLAFLAHLTPQTMHLAMASGPQLYCLRDINLQLLPASGTPTDESSDELEVPPEASAVIADPLPAKTVTINPYSQVPNLLEATLKFARLQTKIAGLQPSIILVSGDRADNAQLALELHSRLRCPVQAMSFDSPTLAQASQENVSPYCLALGAAYLAIAPAPAPLKLLSSYQRNRTILLTQRIFEYGAVLVSVLTMLILGSRNWNLKNYLESQANHWQQQYTRLQERAESTGKLQFKNSPDNRLEIVLTATIEESTKDVYTISSEFREKIEKSGILKIVLEKDPKLDDEEGRLYIELRLEPIR